MTTATQQKKGSGVGVIAAILLGASALKGGVPGGDGKGAEERDDGGCSLSIVHASQLVDPGEGMIFNSATVRCPSPPERFRMVVTLLHKPRGGGGWRNVDEAVTENPPAPNREESVLAACAPGGWQTRVRVTGSRNGKPIDMAEETPARAVSAEEC